MAMGDLLRKSGKSCKNAVKSPKCQLPSHLSLCWVCTCPRFLTPLFYSNPAKITQEMIRIESTVWVQQLSILTVVIKDFQNCPKYSLRWTENLLPWDHFQVFNYKAENAVKSNLWPFAQWINNLACFYSQTFSITWDNYFVHRVVTAHITM